MSFIAKTTTNILPSVIVASNQIINLIYSDAHKEVVSRLMVEAIHRPHRELEEIMHAIHDYLLGYHLGGKKIPEIYINIKIFKPFNIELDPMDETTCNYSYYKSTCICGGIHCQDWEYNYINKDGMCYLDMGSFYNSSYIQSGIAHARINWDFLENSDDETDTTLFQKSSYSDIIRTPSPIESCHTGCKKHHILSNNCAGIDESNIYNDSHKNVHDPDFIKDDRGGINYHGNKYHDRREYNAISAKKHDKQLFYKNHNSYKNRFYRVKKNNVHNPCPRDRHETRNSKNSIKRRRIDEDEVDIFMIDDPESDIPLVKHFIDYGYYDNPQMEPQEQYDSELPMKDNRYHRKKHHYMREKHIRDQEKMARELGIPVARKVKRRDIPTSRYNRHKEILDMEEC